MLAQRDLLAVRVRDLDADGRLARDPLDQHRLGLQRQRQVVGQARHLRVLHAGVGLELERRDDRARVNLDDGAGDRELVALLLEQPRGVHQLALVDLPLGLRRVEQRERREREAVAASSRSASAASKSGGGGAAAGFSPRLAPAPARRSTAPAWARCGFGLRRPRPRLRRGRRAPPDAAVQPAASRAPAGALRPWPARPSRRPGSSPCASATISRRCFSRRRASRQSRTRRQRAGPRAGDRVNGGREQPAERELRREDERQRAGSVRMTMIEPVRLSESDSRLARTTRRAYPPGRTRLPTRRRCRARGSGARSTQANSSAAPTSFV